MLAPQVSEEFVAVQVPHVTVLAERVATVRFVVSVPLPIVQGEIRAGVAAPLERKDFQVVRAQVAVEHLVLAADVLLQQLEGHERLVVASRTRIVQQFVEGVLYLQVGEANAVPLVVQSGPDVGVQRPVRLLFLRVDHLKEQYD